MPHDRIQRVTTPATSILPDRLKLTRYAWLSIAAAVLTIGIKTAAFIVSNSVGLLSDAVESSANLVAGVMALAMLTIAARPPDEEHAFGHSKAEYFASGVEGTLILVAAGSIIWAAIERIMAPRALEEVGIGLILATLASLINLGVSRILLRTGKRYNSITLEADGRHLMTDVWTSAGVLVGLGAATLTGWRILDPLIAIGMAINIVWTGVTLIRRSVLGLMDISIPTSDQLKITAVLKKHAKQGVRYHDLRTRQSGASQFVSFHVLVPGKWSVQRGHDLLKGLESEISVALPMATVSTHLEPIEDPSAQEETILKHRRRSK